MARFWPGLPLGNLDSWLRRGIVQYSFVLRVLICHPVSHESPWITRCSSLIRRSSWNVQCHSICLILISGHLLLSWRRSSRSNCLIRPWSYIVVVWMLGVFNRTACWGSILRPVILKVRIWPAGNITMEGNITVSRRYITDGILQEELASTGTQHVLRVVLSLREARLWLRPCNDLLGCSLSAWLLWLLLLNRVGCEISRNLWLLSIVSSSLFSSRLHSTFLACLLNLACWDELILCQRHCPILAIPARHAFRDTSYGILVVRSVMCQVDLLHLSHTWVRA